MCNNLRKDDASFGKIPEQGKGWKMFHLYGNELHMPYGRSFKEDGTSSRYKKDSSGWVTWGDDIPRGFKGFPNRGDGFCFFLSKKEAIELMEAEGPDYSPILAEIEYKGGLGARDEDGIYEYRSFFTALCTSFRITGRFIDCEEPVVEYEAKEITL